MNWEILISAAIGWIVGWATVKLITHFLSRSTVLKKQKNLLNRDTRNEVEFIYPQDAALKEAFDKGLIKNIDETIT